MKVSVKSKKKVVKGSSSHKTAKPAARHATAKLAAGKGSSKEPKKGAPKTAKKLPDKGAAKLKAKASVPPKAAKVAAKAAVPAKVPPKKEEAKTALPTVKLPTGKKGKAQPTAQQQLAAASAASLGKLQQAKHGKAAAAHFGEGASDSVCREVACENLATSGGYCRMHYIKNWKKIKRKELILREKKLNQYIEELVAKYPDKYIEAIRQDLENDKDFAKVIHDLDLDESIDDYDAEGESVDNLIDNIRRDFDDEGEGF